ncbi:MAG TPA: 3'-5' exonuclease, partial [Halioglobus sp.]
GEPQRRKAQWSALLASVRDIDGLRDRLVAIQILPAMEANSASWQLVLHLSRLLPVLAAQLLLIFQKYGVVDHSQVAQSALLALGEDDTPTELALRLDYQIEHILVDEFQDTAITQYELLHKLTRGWAEHNELYPLRPRTLMIVGDAMQSIYGFRGANVGLFLKARQEGFNGLDLQHLQLRCNFRSHAGVVNWVNQTFMQAFPARDDVHRSEVSYRLATAVRPPANDPSVEIHAFHGEQAREQETAYICQQIARSVARPDCANIAVLGRNRSHLQSIIRQLQQLKVDYYAPELDNLVNSPVVADLLILCRALANDADRLAWLALLRAPWCGLSLADLLSVARFNGALPDTSVWFNMQSTDLHDALSRDGRTRLQYILPPLQRARVMRDRLGLRVWVEQTWVELQGPRCAPQRENLLDAEHFLQLLEQAEMEGVGLDVDWITLHLQKRFVNAGDPDSRVHLMTLHKAKGLEFDRVIIPQLDRIPRSDGRDILLWDEYCNADGQRAFLLAADDHCAQDTPTLYNYLHAQRQRKALMEATRLLYVGTTRAISHLLLTASVKLEDATGQPRNPSRHSLLSSIWQTFAEQMTVHELARAPAPMTWQAPLLRRLQREVREMPPVATAMPSIRSETTATRPDNPVERSIGTVVHLALMEISRHPTLPAETNALDKRRWRMALQREGLWGKVLGDALDKVLNSVEQTLRVGGRGLWILSPDHVEAHNEWALSMVDAQGRIRDIVIDRSFIDKATGIRWVIEYKNSRPAPNELLDIFVARESAAYLDQLQCYRDAVCELGPEPLRCALFFPALGHLHIVSELDLPAIDSARNPCAR